MYCLFCDPDKPQPDLKEFDRPDHHAIITIDRHNHVHIHAPFDNEIVIKTMLRSFQAEMEKRGIKYNNPFGEREETPK